MEPMALDSVPSRVEHFLLERLDDDLLLYHPGLTKMIHLNETASLIWELCNGRRSIREIVALLSEAFPEGGARVVEDVKVTLRRFSDVGAITLR